MLLSERYCLLLLLLLLWYCAAAASLRVEGSLQFNSVCRTKDNKSFSKWQHNYIIILIKLNSIKHQTNKTIYRKFLRPQNSVMLYNFMLSLAFATTATTQCTWYKFYEMGDKQQYG